MFGIEFFKAARPVSVLAVLLSSTAMSPALADCSSDGKDPASVTCTGDVSEISYPGDSDDVMSITVNSLTSDMTGGSGDNALIILDHSQVSNDRTITVDLDGGYSLDSSSGAIYSHVIGVDGTDNSDEDNEGYDTRTGDAGGDGSGAPSLTITISGTQENGDGAEVKAGANQLFDLVYTGGSGGGGGEGHTTSGIHQGTGGKGGDGGDGGDITVTLEDDVYVSGITTPSSNGFTILSTGGKGGNGGEGRSNGAPPAHGGNAGAGGDGGDITVTATSSDNAISVSTGRGILLVSQGGDGGTGGKATTSGHAYPGDGGDAGNGGDITLDWGGSVTTTGDDNVGIYVQSHGGTQGTEGNSGGWVFKKTEPASSGDPGEGGSVTVTLTDASVSTDGNSAFGILAHSVGGMGNAGTDESGIVSYGGTGGTGGAGGEVTVSVTDTTVTTSGDASIGIIVNSTGGGGGSGGSSSGLDAIGGSSGGGGNGGEVSLTLDTSTVTTDGQYADGVVVLSVGGGGGNSGGSSGIVSSGGTDGKGGSGQSATLDISGSTVSTKDDEAAAILVASVGGGGGNAHSSSGLEVMGTAGGDGGDGSTVTYTSTEDTDSGDGTTVSTSGEMSEGIALISVGGGGGKASASFKLSLVGGNQIGAKGASGGDGGDINFTMSDADSISTAGHASEGILAVSVGGGGGKSGSVTTVDVVNDGEAASQEMGATGGAAGNGGDITGTAAGTITTTGTASAGVLAVSVGGGGGVAGNQTTVTVGVSLNSDVGADGGEGGDAGKVDITSSATISTADDLSEGIVAASVGGSGGHSSNVSNITAGENVSDLTVSGGVGAAGGTAGSGDDVTVTLDDSSSIKTKGNSSAGVVGLSVGGSGGNGGTVVDADVSLLSLGVTTGSSGGNGGNAGSVTISNGGIIDTSGHLSMGIVAASVGGSGGKASTVVSGTLSAVAIDMTFGGTAGDGSEADAVSVTNDGAITTAGDLAFGILATSIGGGGGVGGTVVSGSAGVASANITMGSDGGLGGDASTVTVSSSADITTSGNQAEGIAAMSIGGSGGAAGLTVNGSGNAGPISGSVSVAVGGDGGDGGTADTVSVTTTGGTISTTGFSSTGITALSYGGHGGLGGSVVAGSLNISEDGSANFSVAVGGDGGDGGTGGEVEIDNAADITTSGHYSYGIVAISAGGSGGDGGSSYSGSMTLTTGTNIEASVEVGGSGGNGGTADDVTVTNTGDITTTGGNAYAIYALSMGGSGGTGGSGVSYLFNAGTTENSKVSFKGNVYVGGDGGVGSTAGKVTIENSGAISTEQNTTYGIYAQSIGGSGGDGGNAGTFTVGSQADSEGSDPLELDYAVTIGGDGGGGSDGDDVSVTNDASGSISTQGDVSYGIIAQSIGGNGGSGGNGEPDAEGWVADIYDVYEDVRSIKEQYKQLKEANESISSLLHSFTLDIGGSAGDAADGGNVTVSNAGAISTIGDSATAIYAQSIGGGGGNGGDGSQDLLTSLAIAGSSEGGGDSGDITVTNSGTISTIGDGAMGIYAQALGGGGGTGGDIEGSIVHEITDLAETLGAQVFGDSDGGDGGDGGDITITLDSGSSISTTGENAHGIWVQSAGGGGGAMGELTNDDETASAAIGSYGNSGHGGFVDIDVDGDILVTGDGSHGIFAQSASGGDSSNTSGGVRVTVSGSIKTEGENARAILVQADGQKLDVGNSGTCTGSDADTSMCNGTSHVMIEAGATVESMNAGSYGTIAFLSGLQENKASDGSIYTSNLLENYGTVSSNYLDQTVVASDGTASVRIHNHSGGKLIGSIVLTGNADTYDSDYRTEFVNYSGATVELGNTVNLGTKGYYTGEAGSTISPHADKYIGTTVFFLGGNYSEAGTYSLGLSQVTDSSTGTNSVDNDLISIQDKTSAAPDVTFSGVVDPSWLTAPTDSSLMSGTVKIVDSDTTGTFDASGATVASVSAATYTLAADNSSGELNLSYSIDYTGNTTGAVLTDGARDYGTYFTDALTSISNGATDEGTAEALQAVGADYLNASSDAELETLYRQQMPDEAMIGVAEAVQSVHSLHNLLQSCPTIDPTAGLDFLHQNECTWVQGVGSKRHQDVTSESPEYDTSAWGLAIGSQHEVGPDLFLEFGGQIEALSISGDNFDQDGNRYSFGAALKKEIGRFTLSTTVAGGFYGLDYTRHYTASGTAHTANSDIDGRYLGAELRASAVYLGQNGFYAKPSAALAYTRTWQDGFTESGSGSQNWDVSSTDDSWLTFTPMIELGRAFTMQSKASLAFVRAGVTMNLNDPSTSLSSALVGADSSVSDLNSVLSTDRYQGDLSVGVEVMLRENLSMSLLGQTSLSENSYNYGGTARIEFRF